VNVISPDLKGVRLVAPSRLDPRHDRVCPASLTLLMPASSVNDFERCIASWAGNA